MDAAASLEALIRLQKVDSSLDALERVRQEALDALDLHGAKLQAIEVREKEAKKALEDLVKERKAAEIEVQSLEGKLAKYQDQLFSVKSNKEYEALQHEIAEAKREKSRHEERVLELMFREDEQRARIKSLEARAAEEREALVRERRDLETRLAECDASLAGRRAERKKAAQEVPEDLRGAYEALRKSGKRVAAAAVQEDGTCEGCRMEVPSQIRVEVGRGDRVVRCGCGRFLYDPEAAR